MPAIAAEADTSELNNTADTIAMFFISCLPVLDETSYKRGELINDRIDLGNIPASIPVKIDACR
jgi:hypothetical protein